MGGVSPGASVSDEAMLDARPRRRLAREAIVYAEGSEPDQVWFIHDGLVKLETTGAGGATALVAFRGPGEWLGEHAAIDGSPRLTTAIVARDATVTSASRDHFIDAVGSDPELAFRLLTSFVGHLRASVRHELRLASGDPTELVADRLRSLASEPRFASARSTRGGTLSIEMPVSHEELATWAGVSRRSVESALQQFRAAGTISTSRMCVDVHDLAALGPRVTGPADEAPPGTATG